MGQNSEGKEEFFEQLLQVWKNNKLDFLNKHIARTTMVETKCAEYWYFTPDKKLRVMFLHKGNGNEIFPHYDNNGDMDGFLRKYTTVGEDGAPEKRVDIFTDEFRYRYVERGGNWSIEGTDSHVFNKIPDRVLRSGHTRMERCADDYRPV